MPQWTLLMRCSVTFCQGFWVHIKILAICVSSTFLLPVDAAQAQNPAKISRDGLKARALELMGEAPVIEANKVVPTPEIGVVASLEAWRVAWIARDIAAYLSFYSADFVSEDGATFDGWAARRRLAFSRAKGVSLVLANVKVELLDMERAVSTFRQTYRSSAYQDVVDKKIEWKRADGRWLIIGESSLPAMPKR